MAVAPAAAKQEKRARLTNPGREQLAPRTMRGARHSDDSLTLLRLCETPCLPRDGARIWTQEWSRMYLVVRTLRPASL